MARATLAFEALGMACEVQIHAGSEGVAQEACAIACEEIQRVEEKYAPGRGDSVAALINASAGSTQGVDVDEETAALLDFAALAHEQSGGAFDVTAAALRRAWATATQAPPAQAELEALLALSGWHRVQWRRPRLVLPRAGMSIDFGGLVQAYAADAAAVQALALGIAQGLIDLGGDFRVLGPHPDGKPWRVCIRDPWSAGRAIANIELSGGALATRGDYAAARVVGERRYGHVLHPKTGWPVESFASVSVLAPTCLMAATAAASALVMGAAAGGDWLAQRGLPHLCVAHDRRLSGSLAAAAPNAGFL